MTAIRGIKYFIALAPEALSAYGQYTGAGGGAAGARAAGTDILQAYTGYDMNTGAFDAKQLTRGYVPMLGAWVFGKFASRVLR